MQSDNPIPRQPVSAASSSSQRTADVSTTDDPGVPISQSRSKFPNTFTFNVIPSGLPGSCSITGGSTKTPNNSFIQKGIPEDVIAFIAGSLAQNGKSKTFSASAHKKVKENILDRDKELIGNNLQSLISNNPNSRLSSTKTDSCPAHSSVTATLSPYHTAKTSQSESIQSSSVETSNSRVSTPKYTSLSFVYSPNVCGTLREKDNESLLENIECNNLDSPDRDTFNELDHRPPFIPSQQFFSGFGTPSLRQIVIQKQSPRVAPLSDPLVGHMEERLVRWNGPQSVSSTANAIIGKHPYQRPDIPKLETRRSSTSPVPEETAESIESILESAFISNQPQQNVELRQVTFREMVDKVDNYNNTSKQPLSPGRNTSNKDSLLFNCDDEDTEHAASSTNRHQQQQHDSASVSSSILEKFHNMSEHCLRSGNRHVLGDVDEIFSMLDRTPDAIPLNSGDYRDLSKLDDASNGNPFVLQRVEPNPISSFSAYEETQNRETNDHNIFTYVFCCGWSDPELSY